GQVLARLDPSLFEAQAQQSRANLAQARANLTKSQSELERTRIQLLDAQQKYARAKELAARSLLPQSDLDTAKTAVDSAQAVLQSQTATVTQTQAAITQAEASVNQNQVNLDHTIITAPIDGLVISRSVDVGQTVAASMQAPTLFVLAADLTKMQVVANLDESDVGRIRPKQVVTFRVDAYPADTFHGTVSQVRLEPKVQQNVVTYATVIDVPNNDLRLKPGMTANVDVEISRASNVLRIPNSALRFRPSNEVFAAFGQTPPEPAGRGGGRGGRRSGGGPGNGQAPGAAPSATPPASAGRSAAPDIAANTAPAKAVDAPPTAQARVDRPADGTSVSRDGANAPAGQSADANGRGPGGAPGRRPGGGNSADGGTPAASGQAGSDEAGADRRSRFAERLQNLSPEEREAALARMRERGVDPNNPGAGGGRGGFGGRGGGAGDAA
ncbi:MAG: efflux RND transporter periplasmic adaptor subunit, partial [Vicinamibacterales bacterium]